MVFDESPHFGAGYPTSVMLNLEICHKLLIEQQAGFKGFSSFGEMAREFLGGYTVFFGGLFSPEDLLPLARAPQDEAKPLGIPFPEHPDQKSWNTSDQFRHP